MQKIKETLGLKVNEFTLLIQNQIEKVKYDQTFQPIQLPIKSAVERKLSIYILIMNIRHKLTMMT